MNNNNFEKTWIDSDLNTPKSIEKIKSTVKDTLYVVFNKDKSKKLFILEDNMTRNIVFYGESYDTTVRKNMNISYSDMIVAASIELNMMLNKLPVEFVQNEDF